MKGYKGFDSDFTCRGYQYEIGETYIHGSTIKVENSGFHFCATPLEVLKYYPPATSRYALIEASGDIDESRTKDLYCTDKITILQEITIKDLIDIADIECKHRGYHNFFTKKDASAIQGDGERITVSGTGMHSFTSASGFGAIASNTGLGSLNESVGYTAVSVSTGTYSKSISHYLRNHAIAMGDHSIAEAREPISAAVTAGYQSSSIVDSSISFAVALGSKSKAKGVIGSWLVLAEWKDYHPIDVKAVLVDDTNIKANTYYTLVEGKFVEVE